MKRFIATLALSAFALAAATPPKPKLILAVVIDQFRYDYLNRFRKEYNSGLARLLEHGAVYTDAHHIHFPTVTAIGHSTVLSGATPALSGIVYNEWFDRDTGKMVTSVSDPNVKLVGGTPGATGSSPHRLLVSTLADEIKMQGQQAKCVGVSIKDRSAILPNGHSGDAAYWFDTRSDNWVTSTYYMQELPKWVQEINSTHPAQKHAGDSWVPIDAPNAKPLCTMAKGTDGIRACGEIEATPWGNEMIEQMAERAIVEEKLGQHTGTDVLSVSFSSNDYVGHAYGPDSPEVRDISIRTDRLLGKFLDFVDQHVGAGNTLVVMTADHGVSPVPEINQSRHMPGGRLSEKVLFDTISSALSKKYGDGKWIVGNAGPAPYFNLDLIRQKNLNEADVEDTAAEAVRAMPHIFRVYTRQQLLTGQVVEDYVSRAVRNGFNREHSADLFVIPDAYYIFAGSGTSHGTPFNYDTHVPVIFMGTGIKPGHYDAAIAVNDIAPTLAAIVRVEEPSGSIGRILSEMFE